MVEIEVASSDRVFDDVDHNDSELIGLFEDDGQKSLLLNTTT